MRRSWRIHHTRAVPEIDDGQREELERWLRRSKTGQALALRARIVLAAAGGESDVGGGGAAGHDARDGGQVAPPVHREGMRRSSGRAEAGRAAHGR